MIKLLTFLALLQWSIPLHTGAAGSGGGSSAPTYISQSALTYNSGATSITVNYACGAASHKLIALTYSAAAFSGGAVSSMTAGPYSNEASSGHSVQGYYGSCADTASHPYTWTYTGSVASNTLQIVEISSGTLDASGTSPAPSGTTIQASATATTAGLAIVWAQSDGFSPGTYTTGYTIVDSDGYSALWYHSYTSAGVQSFSSTTSGGSSTLPYPAIMMLFH